jgi:hypothetical protein
MHPESLISMIDVGRGRFHPPVPFTSKDAQAEAMQCFMRYQKDAEYTKCFCSKFWEMNFRNYILFDLGSLQNARSIEGKFEQWLVFIAIHIATVAT